MKALSNGELATFCGQLALVLSSGISALEGLSIMVEDTPDGEGKTLLQGMLERMETGGSLYEAVEESGCFPVYMRDMVQLGEQSGRLDDVMQSLSDYYRREDYLAKSIKSAVTYPLVMLGMMVVVMLVLIVRVLPVFNQVFQQLGTELTGVSGAVLRMGGAMSRYSIVFVVITLVLVAVCVYFFGTQRGRGQIKAFSTRFIGTRKLSEMIACGRFASGMHLALSSGLDIDQSLETVARMVEHPGVATKVETMRRLMTEGVSFADAIARTELFSGVYARMVNIGAKTGAVDEVMRQIAEQYDEEIERRMAGAIAKLEPTLVAVLSVAVGMILLSVMLPLMGIMSNIG